MFGLIVMRTAHNACAVLAYLSLLSTCRTFCADGNCIVWIYPPLIYRKLQCIKFSSRIRLELTVCFDWTSTQYIYCICIMLHTYTTSILVRCTHFEESESESIPNSLFWLPCNHSSQMVYFAENVLNMSNWWP